MFEDGIIQLAAAGDKYAVTRILFAYEHLLREHIANRLPRRLRGKFSVDDVLQETQIRIVRSIKTFEGTTELQFVAWLKRISENQLTTMVRAHQADRRGGKLHQLTAKHNGDSGCDPMGQAEADSNDLPRRIVERGERAQVIHGLLDDLPSDWRTALKLRHLEGESVDTIAARMNRSEGAVRGYLHRAKKQLKEWLGKSSKWFGSR